jgi:hypothetical protein
MVKGPLGAVIEYTSGDVKRLQEVGVLFEHNGQVLTKSCARVFQHYGEAPTRTRFLSS